MVAGILALGIVATPKSIAATLSRVRDALFGVQRAPMVECAT